MTEQEHELERRLKELESSVQQLRLEALQVGGLLLAKMNEYLANSDAEMEQTGELAALNARHQMLTRMATDAQAKIDTLLAEQHDLKYYR